VTVMAMSSAEMLASSTSRLMLTSSDPSVLSRIAALVAVTPTPRVRGETSAVAAAISVEPMMSMSAPLIVASLAGVVPTP
jgi:hypothetical protein